MSCTSQYITRAQYDSILAEVNGDTMSAPSKDDLLERASADLEADLAEKFVVPLVGTTGSAYSTTPTFARNKILNAMKAKIKELFGYDKNRELTGTIESTERFLNVHGGEYKNQIKQILNNKVEYGFKRLDQADDAQSPVQHIALSKADNESDPFGSTSNGGLY
jgi:hypothetical protein